MCFKPAIPLLVVRAYHQRGTLVAQKNELPASTRIRCQTTAPERTALQNAQLESNARTTAPTSNSCRERRNKHLALG